MTTLNSQSHALPEALAASVEEHLQDWRAGGKVRRLWERDASLWTGRDEARWLGWLTVAEETLVQVDVLEALAAELAGEGVRDAVVLGMGGSSLCPDVLRGTFGRIEGHPRLHVLDSTDPAQVRAVERAIDLPRAVFIVSSKSGSTLEPNIFMRYFLDRVRGAVGKEPAGRRFVAITDPGSELERSAQAEGFRRVLPGVASVGGRFSALSNFGMGPAAVMGLDVRRFLELTRPMVRACGADVPPQDNPGVVLGAILGAAAQAGRDKVTIVASPRIAGLGGWLEQLLAESTGKEGLGLVPVDGETLGAPSVYGDDRVFAQVCLEGNRDPAQEAALDALERAGHPVVRIEVSRPEALGQEFFRWEIATAVAGSILGLHPFDQPDVEAAKLASRRLMAAYEEAGSLPSEAPLLVEGGLSLFADALNAADLTALLPARRDVHAHLAAHFGRLVAGDYFGLLAYLEMSDATRRPLQRIRQAVRDARQVATCLGFGPRFLHSTGQAYKGGPNTGVFLQVTCDDAEDLPVPGQRYTFGVVKAAQARGDLDVLAERGRRALRVHLGRDVPAQLEALEAAVVKALR